MVPLVSGKQALPVPQWKVGAPARPGPHQIAAPWQDLFAAPTARRIVPHDPLSQGSEDAPFDWLSICCKVIRVSPRCRWSSGVEKWAVFPDFSRLSLTHSATMNLSFSVRASEHKPETRTTRSQRSLPRRFLSFSIKILCRHIRIPPCPRDGLDGTDCVEVYKLRTSSSRQGGTRHIINGCLSDCRSNEGMMKSAIRRPSHSASLARWPWKESDPS